MIMMVLLGGSGTLYGPILGALAYLLLEEGLSRLTEHWKVILGPLLVLLVLFGRGGIAGVVERWRRGELSLARLRTSIGGAASAARTRVASGWQRVTMLGTRVLVEGWPLAQRGLAQAAARWRRWTMAIGDALVSLVLLMDRGITGAVARWRRR
jgi:ABC-type branched-subunit amino acid transport system permease subunit